MPTPRNQSSDYIQLVRQSGTATSAGRLAGEMETGERLPSPALSDSLWLWFALVFGTALNLYFIARPLARWAGWF